MDTYCFSENIHIKEHVYDPHTHNKTKTTRTKNELTEHMHKNNEGWANTETSNKWLWYPKCLCRLGLQESVVTQVSDVHFELAWSAPAHKGSMLLPQEHIIQNPRRQIHWARARESYFWQRPASICRVVLRRYKEYQEYYIVKSIR